MSPSASLEYYCCWRFTSKKILLPNLCIFLILCKHLSNIINSICRRHTSMNAFQSASSASSAKKWHYDPIPSDSRKGSESTVKSKWLHNSTLIFVILAGALSVGWMSRTYLYSSGALNSSMTQMKTATTNTRSDSVPSSFGNLFYFSSLNV